MGVVLRAVDLWKVYGTGADKVEALKGVNLSLERGTFSFLMGASGSGKSTLLHVLGTLDTPTKGRVLFEDKDLFSLTPDELSCFRNKKLGFVFQFHYLIEELTVLENVMAPLLIAGLGRELAREKAENLLRIVELWHRLSHRPFEISGGERQRVAVARALVNEPVLVLADEPTGNLDTHSAHAVLSLMKELNREFGTTFLIATHNKELEKFADNIYFIRDGVLTT